MRPGTTFALKRLRFKTRCSIPAHTPKVGDVPPSSASPPAGKLYRRRAEIAAELAQLGPPLPGSIVERHTRSAKRACRCRSDPPQLHGPYLVWTPTKNAKTVTPQRAAQLQPWIDNARRLRELVGELHQLAIDEAEHHEGWPRT